MSAVTSPYGPGKTRSKDGRFPASESLRNLLAPRPSDGIVAKRQATVTGHVTDSSRGMRESRAGGGGGGGAVTGRDCYGGRRVSAIALRIHPTRGGRARASEPSESSRVSAKRAANSARSRTRVAFARARGIV
jgi:hypothetical protein